ncbi:hypothetical protein [Pseudomonas oryzihabitans]|uniref:Uncharacterized protein n=1 Tax=Pseudomonas oryzihabitans TaxID=47885 RepID=A0AAJ2C0H0_9PSED|nr:hypothetical protein [Pseudomonas psychrotolerans]MDR6235808.1 hypothetical protein [Pseudomonas psychrotolerans]
MTAFDDPHAFVNRVREQAADAERSGDIPRLLQLVDELASAFERQARSTAQDNADVVRAVEEFERHEGT